jgi:hypothetical protein
MAQHVIDRNVFQEGVGSFSRVRKDVMYDLLKRKEINWRALNSQAAKAVYQQNNLIGSRVKVFIVDDSIKTRREKKKTSPNILIMVQVVMSWVSRY